MDEKFRNNQKQLKAGIGVNFRREAGAGETEDSRNLSNNALL